ncbi:MAG TPA: amino acid adenylation domain-containing protein, partial [Thermoanaerobaculia bacterium]|nr:amino acid adenylation domain-containing protein [Thermoanaerobaculia bacterium]
PALPPARLALLVEDACRGLDRPVLVAQGGLEEVLAGLPLAGVRVVAMDDAEEAGEQESVDLPGPASLAYLIYTSGTTGVPKAVMVEHGSLSHTLWAVRTAFSFTADDRMPCLAPFPFDIFLFELLGPLLAGGTAVLYDLRPAPDVPRLARELSGMTLLHSVPALMRQVVEELERQGSRPGIRRVFVGGDAVPGDLLAAMRQTFPQAVVTVLYGPTEGTIIAAHHPVTGTEPPARLLIGRPLPGAGLELRDRDGHLVPIGIPGEIWLAGRGVTRGYLHRPELTAEKYVAMDGRRLYRSGDLGRLLPDGTVEFLGRVDQQVKVRGFRVELGEIEAVLAGHPAMREAVVLARRGTEGGGDRLVAFVVPRQLPADGLVGELRELLQARLPEYMVPAAWVVLESVPLTPHGKVDRRALAARVDEAGMEESGGGTKAWAAPRTATEELLAGIWAELLGPGRDLRVGRHDDFFDLGGHSLLATRLVTRMGSAFGVEVPLRAVFEAPTVEALARKVEEALAGSSGSQIPPIQPVSRDGVLPLSFTQESLWFLHRLDPQQSLYNVPFPVRLEGRLDVAVLRRSLDEITRRHEVLRTTFPAAAGEPRQEIGPFLPRPLPVIDLAALPEEMRRPEAWRVLTAEGRRPFDLARGPLLDTLLLRAGEHEAILLFNVHHIVSDGWSMGIVTAELAAIYGAFVRGLPLSHAALPELPIQYADFAAWQRQWLSGKVLARQTAYWRRELAGAPTLLALPTARPQSARPVRPSPEAGILEIELPAELTGTLRVLAQTSGATLFMTLLAAFQTLLHRYTGQEDVLVGSPVANRTRPEIQDLIGLFINTLVLRGRFSGEERGEPPVSCRRLMERTRQAALGAYAHQDLPFERLVEELRIERDLAYNPLVQATFSLQVGDALPSRHLPGLRVAAMRWPDSAAKFDLSLVIEEAGDRLRGELIYRAGLFDHAMARRMAGHLRALLEGMAADPDRPVSELPLLPEVERRELLLAGAGRPQAEACLHERFLEQAARTPGAVALEDETGARLTYGELAGRAGRLAHVLRRQGVGLETPVGVFLERSPDLVTALLGTLLAGGVYLPLDPAHPPARTAALLADAGAPVVLTSRGLRDRLPPSGRLVVAVDEIEAGQDDPAAGPALPGSAACLLYTSGSTGTPKAVAVEHRMALQHMETAAELLGIATGDRVLQFAAATFDTSLEQIWTALLRGATLVLRGSALWPPAGLLARVADLGLTVINLPTAYWQQWVHDVAGLAAPPAGLRLRLVLVGGEAMTAEAARLWLAGPLGAVKVINGYGPTEAVVTATAVALESGALPEVGIVEIGRPLPGRNACVLDRNGELAPAGVAGELCLGGILARGYPGRADLTAERFVPDPFATVQGGRVEPGARLYRTGDLARCRPDGSLEFMGRVDRQVKLRGFRIEPGEIEAVLASHPEVREAAVLPLGGPAGTRLVAFVVPRQMAGDGLASEVRKLARSRLPEPLVPSAWIVRESLPLTPHGKVDRKALASFAESLETPGAEGHVPPRTQVEEVLAEIWSDLLGRERVGVHDGFFELGGHSLLATRMVARVEEALSVELPLQVVFEAATLAKLASRIEAVVAGEAEMTAPPIRPVPLKERGVLPLSFAQERLWFLDRLEPNRALYNVPFAMRLTGPLDVASLNRTLDEIVRRHEALRTTFPDAAGEPRQEVAPFVHRPLPVADLTALPEDVREAESDRWLAEEATRSFDLACGPLLRTLLLRLDADKAVLLLNTHHIVSDGWSMGVMTSELAALYDAYFRGLSSPLPELAVQYADFAVWQRQWLSGKVLERQIAYWRQELAGAPDLLELPTDRPRTVNQTRKGGEWPVSLPAGLARDVRALGRGQGATLFMTLLAAYQTLLSRLTGQDDLLVGMPIANRNRAETEGLIGFFANTLALRGKPAGERSFRSLLVQVRDTALGAYSYQDVPFERLVEELRVKRSLDHNPLVQAVFALQNAFTTLAQPAGLSLSHVLLPLNAAKFDLSLSLEETGGEIAGLFEHSADLLDDATVGRWAGHFRELLAGAVAEPDRPLSSLPMLSAAERRQLAEWNDTAVPEGEKPADVPVHRLFEAQAERTPGDVAVVFGGEELTYAELDRRAGRLAGRLRALGVGAEARVGLLLRRSVDLVAAILAVWKAGGAYVPLDPGLPQARLAMMVEDAFEDLERPVLLTQKGLEEVAAGLSLGEARVLLVDGEEEPATEAAGASSDGEIGRLAYLIYTSGTTGRPKAVMVEHGQLAHTLRAARLAFGFAPGDRMPCLAAFSFDIFLFELLGPLLAGGTAVLYDLRPAPDVPGLARDLSSMTLMHAVPALMRQVVEELDRQGSRPGLRRVFVGGDAVPGDLLAAMRQAFPAARITILYGPTEAAIIAARHEVTGSEPASRLLIGRPLPDVTLDLRDRSGNLVPVGVPGEIWLGGPGVTRGYLHRPELTAAVFAAEEGRRFYRTGDLSRRAVDGTVEFLGRIDQQVKVRGFRVELGEIEAALAAAPGVRQAVVLVREWRAGRSEGAAGSPGDRRLVAYVAGAAGDISVEELSRSLRGRLPEYMVPSAWVVLEALPLTSHGKVDRRALAAIEPVEEGGEPEAGGAPRTPAEELLAGLWAEILGRARIGIHDDFFEAGGHSLLATRVISRLRDAFGVDLPLRVLFEAPTVASLAARVEVALAEGRGLQAPPIRPVPRGDGTDLPLSFTQERFWFLDQLEPGSPLYTMAGVLRLTGLPDVPALERAFNEIVRRHEALRTTFEGREGKPFQRVHARLWVPLPLMDLRSLAAGSRDAEVQRVIKDEERQPFDLSTGPLLRLGLLRLEESSWILLFTLHHIVSDAWSSGLLIRELATLYGAFSRGLPPERPVLPELPVQYADFAVWQREWLAGEVLAEQVGYWTRALEGAPTLVELPSDRPRLPGRSLRSAVRRLDLPDELATGLQALSRRGGATLFMTLLAGFDALLFRHTGQADLLVGTPIANRNRGEIEGLIGCFINTLVLRGRMDDGTLSFSELLERVKSTTLEAYVHQDLPLEKVVEALQVERTATHNPLFQVMFALQNAPLGELALPGLTLTPVETESELVTNFDLSLGLTDIDGGLWGGCIYRLDLFDEATVDRLLERFRAILEAVVADPARPLLELPGWLEEHRAQIAAAERNAAGMAAATAHPQGEKEEDPEEAARTRLAAREEKVAEKRSALSDKKKAALAKLLKGKQAAAPAASGSQGGAPSPAPAPAFPRRPDPSSAVLSFAQERLWFLDRLEPGTALYNIAIPLRLNGRLDPRAAERSLAELVRRHEVLRTTFAGEGGEARQIIGPAIPPPLPVVDLRGLPAAAREAELQRQVRDESLRPFDLERGPLLRAFLLRLDAEVWAGVFNLHHIVSDAWSSGILVREFGTLYSAFAEGRAPALPELPIQYGDFAHWQRQWLSGEVLEAQLSYWERELADAPPLLELATDRPRSSRPGSAGAVESVDLRAGLAPSLRALSLSANATLFMTVLAAFQVLLHRYTAQDDVLVGSAIANRTRPEVQALIGFFVNTLVLRGRCAPEPALSFRRLLDRTREAALGAYAHQDLPFERLV